MLIVQYLLTILIAYIVGKLIRKMEFPDIIGWLITGVILGPHLLNLFSAQVIDSTWYKYVSILAHMSVGALIAVNLKWKDFKKMGIDILKLNISQISGSFIVVFTVGAIMCKIFNIPVLIALLAANISIALAPAPPITVIEQYNTKGPLTDTVIPLTVTDSILSSLIFYTIISIVQAKVSTLDMTLIMTLTLLMFIPIIMGLALGALSSRFIKEKNNPEINRIISFSLFLAVTIIGYLIDNYLFPEPMMNYILLGMGFIAGIVNCISSDMADEFKISWTPIINAGLIIVIINSSAPINIKLLPSVGWVSIVYILARGVGRISGNYIGSKIIKAQEVITKYCGITTLSHLGLSLIYTGISSEVAQLISPKGAGVLAVALPLASLINEVIALILSKKAYEWAGEINLAGENRKKKTY